MLSAWPIKLSVHNTFQNGNFFSYQQWQNSMLLLCLFWEKLLKNKGKNNIGREKCVTSTAEIWEMDDTIILDLTAIFKWGSGEWREGVNSFFFLFFFWGESANAVPNSHKLCSRVPHIWGNRRLQLHLSAMVESRPEGTALLITVSFEPGKYD